MMLCAWDNEPAVAWVAMRTRRGSAVYYCCADCQSGGWKVSGLITYGRLADVADLPHNRGISYVQENMR